jgi:nucleoside-diphosphate-sugar epimerase
VVSRFITALVEGRPPTVHGDGGQTRDFTYVANAVDGVLRAAEVPGIAGEVFNVATGGRVSLNELLARLQRIIGANVAAERGPVREGDVRDSQADIEKARRTLGYEPSVSLDEGLRRTVEWFRASTA